MVTYLTRFGFYGIKNIKETVSLLFYKRSVDKNFDPSEYRIKSIYGENGSGKTTIVTAFSILKKLIMYPDYLSDPKTQDLLNHIVNKERNSFKIYAEFYFSLSSAPVVLYYEIAVGRDDKTGLFEIKNELLRTRRGTYTQAPYHDVYEVENGRFINLAAVEEVKGKVLLSTMNLLNKSSAISKLMELVSYQAIDEANELAVPVLLTQFSAFSMYAFLNEDDDHSLYFARKNIEKLREVNNITDEQIDKTLCLINEAMSLQADRVSKDAFAALEKKVNKLADFIRIFKPSLKGIDVDKKDAGDDSYQVSLVFNYGTYRVDYEFESTGIKKMVQTYEAIWRVAHGGIVFIDEFDANVNSVFFDKLIEYVRDYSDGQLCFTVHNTSSMDSLREEKESINFLTRDNQIIRWVKNGHYSPDVLYRKGMIEKLPFNIYESDFVSIFEDDNE